MKTAMLVMTIALALFILIPNLSWAANEEAPLYKTKGASLYGIYCAECHGSDAAGNPKGSMPNLIDEVNELSDIQWIYAVKKKGREPLHPHKVRTLRLTEVELIRSYVRSLQIK